MATVSYTLKSTVKRNAADAIPGPGEGTNLKYLVATKSVTARTAGHTMKIATLPSNARLAGSSLISFDDLASSGSPTLDAGIAANSDPANAYTADPDALNDGIDIATAAGTAKLIKDHANYGKALWELFGLTSDPGILLDIYVSFVDANTNATGDVTVEIFYFFD